MEEKLGSGETGKCLYHSSHQNVTYAELPSFRLQGLTNPYCLIPDSQLFITCNPKHNTYELSSMLGMQALQQLSEQPLSCVKWLSQSMGLTLYP